MFLPKAGIHSHKLHFCFLCNIYMCSFKHSLKWILSLSDESHTHSAKSSQGSLRTSLRNGNFVLVWDCNLRSPWQQLHQHILSQKINVILPKKDCFSYTNDSLLHFLFVCLFVCCCCFHFVSNLKFPMGPAVRDSFVNTLK